MDLRKVKRRHPGAVQIHKIRRDRYKWAEHAMDGVIPPDIAREKQDQLTRQLAKPRS